MQWKTLTRDDFAALSGLEAGENGGLVGGRVYTGLNALLEHRGRPAGPKVIGQQLDTLLV